MPDGLSSACPSCGREGHFHRDRVDGLLARGLISPGTLAQDSGTPCDCVECRPSTTASSAAPSSGDRDSHETLGTLRRKLRTLGTRHPSWREPFKARRGPLHIQRGFRVTAVDASGAEFGFGVYAGWDDIAEQMANELAELLNALQWVDTTYIVPVAE
jgi:hypothetical protein